MPQAIEHEWAYSRDPNCILVLFLEGRTVNVAAASGSGPDPALHRFTSIFPSGLQYGPDSWRHRKHSAGCRCLSVGNEYGAISAICPMTAMANTKAAAPINIVRRDQRGSAAGIATALPEPV